MTHATPNPGWLTTTTVLQRLRELDESAWSVFVERFRDPIIRFARGCGVDQQAEDVAQSTLLTFVEGVRTGRYDKQKGRLRSWLLGIARNKIREVGRREERSFALLDEDAPMPESDAAWDAEWERALLLKGLLRLREELPPESFRCYVLVVLEGRSVSDVAEEMSLTPNAVSIRKHRAGERMRAILAELEQV